MTNKLAYGVWLIQLFKALEKGNGNDVDNLCKIIQSELDDDYNNHDCHRSIDDSCEDCENIVIIQDYIKDAYKEMES
jgi:hypothetical protein